MYREVQTTSFSGSYSYSSTGQASTALPLRRA